MLAYLVRRIVFGAAVLVGTSVITFAIAFIVPADPAVAMAGAKADPQTLASIRSEMGLDRPLYIQYARYFDRAIHGDLGRSYIRRESVTRLIVDRFPATAVLACAAIPVALAFRAALWSLVGANPQRSGLPALWLLLLSAAAIAFVLTLAAERLLRPHGGTADAY